MANIKVGVIGYGYWGPNIVRNFFATADCTVRMVADGTPGKTATYWQKFSTHSGR